MMHKMNKKMISLRTVMARAAVALSIVGACVASGTAAATNTAAASQRLANIKTKGDQEITRRLNSLTGLVAKINAASKLTTSDKQVLSSEVTAEITGLTALKTQLDGETTVEAAAADAKSILSDYRVYALIVPKVALVRNADDQQVTEQKLATLAQKLQVRITAAQQAGNSIATLQTTLSDMQAKIAAAQTISTQIQTSVIALQPSDFNSNHAVLSGDAAQLKTAHQDNAAALVDAKAIVTSLKNLKK
jgi:predicted PurR-regulated permease PerM